MIGKRSGHESARKEFNQMNSFPNKILLATDGSEDADLAARAASELSNRTAAELHVVHVWHDVPTPPFHSFVRAQLRQEAEEILQKQLERIAQAGGTVAQAHLREGRTVDEILNLSEELDVGLLIVGSRGLGGVKRILWGSVSEGLVHHSRLPVLVMRGGQNAWPPSWVIIGGDSSEDARETWELATSISELVGATALLVRAYPRLPEADPEGRELDPRMVEDALGREKSALETRAEEIEEASADTATGRDSRGRSRGVPHRGRRRSRPGEGAHRRGESRSGRGAAIAARERLDQGLEGFRGAGSGR
jgi:nucleotide-binding universal stress UspA family protein